MPVKKSSVVSRQSSAKKAVSGLIVPVYALDGKESGSLELPKDLFGAKVNKPLLAQALRVYMNNTKGHFSNTKTRGEVIGSTRKIRAQKGTGGARHGSIKAPIFVGGGIALGPKFRKVMLELPKKMKKAALISALSAKLLDKEVVGLTGVDKLSGKTIEAKGLLKALSKKHALLVVGEKNEKLSRAASNLSAIGVLTADQLNAYSVIRYQTLALTKEAVTKLETRMNKPSFAEASEDKGGK